MDRFGYSKTIDVSSYERNTEAIQAENKTILRCMNTDRLCIFTDKGNLHLVKVLDVPFAKFRDKGKPIDNLGNYSSKEEDIVLVCSFGRLKGGKLLFTTKNGMMKTGRFRRV
jgi:DNA gyrase subunit A